MSIFATGAIGRRGLKPARLLALSFAAAAFGGALLLMTPWASAGNPLGFTDAFFTAMSATCVTGLTVVDTGSQLTSFGQIVVLTLIQLGGLGIMTYSSLVLLLLRRRLSFSGESLLFETLGHREMVPHKVLIRNVFLFTVCAEASGALFLFLAFAQRMPLAEAAYHGIFHSISAFCNAGFALHPDSFTSYRADWIVNCTLMGLIIAGGLGFVVFTDVGRALRSLHRRTGLRLRLHTKVVLAYSLGLTAAGALLIFVFESGNSLSGMGPPETLLACLFQSVTPRTAGFNTIDYGIMRDVTLFATVGLMFVGASPGSCGGGIKTTAFAIVFALFKNRMLGRGHVTIFHRTIPDDIVNRAISILVASFILASVMAFLLLFTEVSPHPHRGESAVFLDVLFESVSAFGTVGLSTGLTAKLSTAGRWIVITTMFAGRLGPLTLATAVGRSRRPTARFADEGVMVG